MRLLGILFSFSLLLAAFLSIVPQFQTTYAQLIFVGGTQSSGEVGVNTTQPLQIDVLWDKSQYGNGKDYRIELGESGDDDKYLQYNLNISDNANCSPADFGDNEQNKNSNSVNVVSCSSDENIQNIRMVARITLSTLGLQSGKVYTLKLKEGRDGGSGISNINLRVLNSATLEINPSAISAGTPVTVTITNLAPYSSYTAYLTLADGTESSRSRVTFSTTADGCANLPSGVFTVSSCQKENSGISVSINVNTTGYNCTPGGATPDTFSTCHILIKTENSSGGPLARDTLQVYTGFYITLDIPPNSSVSRPEIAGDPIAEYNFYEGNNATLTARGCLGTDATVTFRSYKDGITCDGTNCAPTSGRPADETVPVTSTDAIARWSKSFDPDSSYAKFVVTATCEVSNQTDSVFFTVFSTSASESDAHIILPERIIANQDWSFLIQGLDTRFGARFDRDADACYFYQLLQFDGAGNRVNLSHEHTGECGDLGGSIDQKYQDETEGKEGLYYRAFEPTSPEETMAMIGLESGDYEYEIRLYKVNRGNNNDSLVDSVRFCVAENEDDASCDNELRETSEAPPPPKPPCANSIEGDGKCTKINTALGPIDLEPTAFITNILGILLSLSGGIAVLIISFSGYKIMTSGGNPEVIQDARERLTSAIVGLIFIIFSLVIIQVIGVDILRIPGFGS